MAVHKLRHGIFAVRIIFVYFDLDKPPGSPNVLEIFSSSLFVVFFLFLYYSIFHRMRAVLVSMGLFIGGTCALVYDLTHSQCGSGDIEVTSRLDSVDLELFRAFSKRRDSGGHLAIGRLFDSWEFSVSLGICQT